MSEKHCDKCSLNGPVKPVKPIRPIRPIGVFEERGRLLGKIVDKKQAAYGDSFGKSGAVLRLFYPDGIKPDQYDDALGLVRVIDKQFRIATDRDALGESPWRDIAGYGLLGENRVEKEKKDAP